MPSVNRRAKRTWTRLDLHRVAAAIEDDTVVCPLRNVHTVRSNLTPTVALDCEMVGVGNGNPLRLARVSILNEAGKLILDLYVKPESKVTRYYVQLNGITERHMRIAIRHAEAVAEVQAILSTRHVIGHSIAGDLKEIYGYDRWPSGMTFTDIAACRPLWPMVRPTNPGQRPGLRLMAAVLLGRSIQAGAHSSIEDARAALDIYIKFREVIENYLL